MTFDRAQIINEEIDKLNSAKLNSMTYMFSVAATIFLPLTFLTGLLGINIGGMPGVDRGSILGVYYPVHYNHRASGYNFQEVQMVLTKIWF